MLLFYRDGRKEVIAATSLNYVEVIQGEDGAKTTGTHFTIITKNLTLNYYRMAFWIPQVFLC